MGRRGDKVMGRQGEKKHRVSLSPGLLVSASPSLRVALPYLALFGGLACIGFSAIFTKSANAPGTVSAFYRMAIATVVMTIPFALRVRRQPQMHARSVLFAVLAGLFFVGDLVAWNTALYIGDPTMPTLFGNTSAIWVGLGALVLFREKLKPLFWVGLALALLGILVVLGTDSFASFRIAPGDLLGLVSGFFYGAFFLVTERARDGLSSLVSWWISAFTCAVGLLALCLVFNQPLTGYSINSWLNLLALALIVQVVGWMLINYALGHLPASIVSPTLLGQPIITAILAVPIFGEVLTLFQIVGGAMVLMGIFLVHKSKG